MSTATAHKLDYPNHAASSPAARKPAGAPLQLIWKNPAKQAVLPHSRSNSPALAPAPASERGCITLALVSCNRCLGLGSYPVPFARRLTVCNCVYRGVFRACYRKWRDITDEQRGLRLGASAVSRLGRVAGRRASGAWARPSEEFRADFELIARRALDSWHHAIFRLHFLEGLDWKVCCRRLGVDRGNFFHGVYRVEQRLGKAYRESRPYALFPIAEYFA